MKLILNFYSSIPTLRDSKISVNPVLKKYSNTGFTVQPDLPAGQAGLHREERLKGFSGKIIDVRSIDFSNFTKKNESFNLRYFMWPLKINY